MQKTIAITPGCYLGIGPEIAEFAIKNYRFRGDTKVICCGSNSLYSHFGSSPRRRGSRVSSFGLHSRLREDGRRADGNECGAEYSMLDSLAAQKQDLLDAVSLAKSGAIHALVTGPVRKAALVYEGMQYAGQTEFLHHFLASDDRPPLMCFVGGPFILGLTTVHMPLSRVPTAITKQLIRSSLERLQSACLLLTPTANPRILVLGLNPHAGEAGLLGAEDIQTIEPVVDEMRRKGMCVEGPIPADGFFGNLHRMRKGHLPDAVLAMYHDQGLSPYKLLGESSIVNVTIGLRIARTSPSHGTADDIVGRGLADPSSFMAALALAERLAHGMPLLR